MRKERREGGKQGKEAKAVIKKQKRGVEEFRR